MINYIKTRESADKAIRGAGQSGFIRRQVVSTPGTDPWDPGTSTPANYPIKFVLIAYSEFDRDGTHIQQKDQKALISAQGLTIVPNDDDQLVDSSGGVWEIIKIEPLRPGDVTVMYTAQIRQ